MQHLCADLLLLLLSLKETLNLQKSKIINPPRAPLMSTDRVAALESFAVEVTHAAQHLGNDTYYASKYICLFQQLYTQHFFQHKII